MRLILCLFTAVLLAGGCAAGTSSVETDGGPLGPYEDSKSLVRAVELGEASPDVFVHAVREGPVRCEDISPVALANYLEAFAWERMLDRIPARFVKDDEMILSFETVFEDSRNVFNNWEVYKKFLQKVYKADPLT